MTIKTQDEAMQLDPKIREAKILEYRRRVVAGEKLSKDELQAALLLTRAGRSSRTGIIPKGKAKAKKAEVQATALSEF